MKEILLVEDNEIISKGLKYSLEQEKFLVTIKDNVKQAKEEINKNKDKYNLIILDIALPDGNGFELCKFIKEKTSIPVIFLTAKDEEQDVVEGFDLGADDYVIKPFRNRELISRINNIFRRYDFKDQNSLNNNSNIIEAGNIKLDLEAKRVYSKEKEIILTALEYKILVLLFNNINRTVTREEILDKIWDIAGNFVEDNTLTVYIKRIRQKLGEDIIKTIKGIGYRVDK